MQWFELFYPFLVSFWAVRDAKWPFRRVAVVCFLRHRSTLVKRASKVPWLAWKQHSRQDESTHAAYRKRNIPRAILSFHRLSLSGPSFYTLRQASVLYSTLVCITFHSDLSLSHVGKPVGSCFIGQTFPSYQVWHRRSTALHETSHRAVIVLKLRRTLSSN